MGKTKVSKLLSSESKIKANYGLLPWKSEPKADHTEIQAHVVATGKWETILIVPNVHGHAALAQFILNTVNEIIENENLMLAAMNTMKTFLVETDFPPKIEEPVVDLIARIEKTYNAK